MKVTKIKDTGVWIPYFMLLGVLTLTVIFSYLELGYYNDLLSWFFAAVKTYLILYFYMHITRELEGSRIYFILGFITLLILVVGVLDDVLMRAGGP